MLTGIKQILKEALNTAVALLPEAERIPVETEVQSLSSYNLAHPIGAILLFYKGSAYSENKLLYAVEQDRLCSFGVQLVLKGGKEKPHEDWIDFVLTTVSGIEFNQKVSFVQSDEFVDEVEGIWVYEVTVTVPVEFFK